MTFLRSFLPMFVGQDSSVSLQRIFFLILGNLFLALVSNALSDQIKGFVPAFLLVWVILSIGSFILVKLMQTPTIPLALKETSEFPAMDYLFTSISPFNEFTNKQGEVTGNNAEPLATLIQYHRSKLKKVYFITTAIDPHSFLQPDGYFQKDAPETTSIHIAFNYVQQSLERTGMAVLDADQIQFIRIMNSDEAEESYQVVKAELDKLKSSDNHVLSQTVIDVTAGKKSMSVGLTIAAIEYGVKLTYQAAPRDKSGNPHGTEKNSRLVILDLK